MVAKRVILLCARSQETDSCHCFGIIQIKLRLSSCQRTGLCSNYETCLGSQRKIVRSVASLEHGAEMHPTVSLSTALVAVSCHCYLGLLLVWLTDFLTTYTPLINNSLSNREIGNITQMG